MPPKMSARDCVKFVVKADAQSVRVRCKLLGRAELSTTKSGAEKQHHNQLLL